MARSKQCCACLDSSQQITLRCNYCSKSVCKNRHYLGKKQKIECEEQNIGYAASYCPWFSEGIFNLSSKDPNHPVIQLKTLHISCKSDDFDCHEQFAGLIIYSYENKMEFILNRIRCKSGYILIKKEKNIRHIPSSQGQVHGKLFKWLFNIEPDKKFVGAGFAFMNHEWKFNSMTFNGNNDAYHDDQKYLHDLEQKVLLRTLKRLYMNNQWKLVDPNISVLEIQYTDDD